MNARPTVVALGDSVSYGMGDAGADWIGPSWVGRFAHAVKAHRLVYLCRPGQRAQDLAGIQCEAAVLMRPDVALVSIGGNDVLRASMDPYLIAHSVSRLIRELTALGTRVVVLGVPKATVHACLPSRIVRIINARVELVNNALEVAVATGTSPGLAIWLDVSADLALAEPSLWHIDRMHPSPQGHDYLAHKALVALGMRARGPRLVTEEAQRSLVDSARWLVRHGTPWLMRRMLDLIPQMLFTLAFHQRHYARLSQRLEMARTDLAVDTVTYVTVEGAA